MPIFQRADEDVHELALEMMNAFHPWLRDAKVSIDCVMAHAKTDDNGDPIGPALKLHGVTCAAVVRILRLKDRAMGRADAEITIDGDCWPTWSDAEKRALLDHELNHLQLKISAGGEVRRDDLDRPVLTMKHHDYDFGWFVAIAGRHGAASFECKQAEQVFSVHGQLLFGFAAPGPAAKAEAFLNVKKNQVQDILRKTAKEKGVEASEEDLAVLSECMVDAAKEVGKAGSKKPKEIPAHELVNA